MAGHWYTPYWASQLADATENRYIFLQTPDDPTRGEMWTLRKPASPAQIWAVYERVGGDLRPAYYHEMAADSEGTGWSLTVAGIQAYYTNANTTADRELSYTIPAGFDCVHVYIYKILNNGGMVKVEIDGVDKGNIDTGDASSVRFEATYTALGKGEHAVKFITTNLAGTGGNKQIRTQGIIAYESDGTCGEDDQRILVGATNDMHTSSSLEFALELFDSSPATTKFIGGYIHQGSGGNNGYQDSPVTTFTVDGAPWTLAAGYKSGQIVMTRTSTALTNAGAATLGTFSEVYTFESNRITLVGSFTASTTVYFGKRYVAMLPAALGNTILASESRLFGLTGASGARTLTTAERRLWVYGGMGGHCSEMCCSAPVADLATITFGDDGVYCKAYWNLTPTSGSLSSGQGFNFGWTYNARYGLELKGRRYTLVDAIADVADNPVMCEGLKLSAAAAKTLTLGNDASSKAVNCWTGPNVTIDGAGVESEAVLTNCVLSGNGTNTTRTNCVLAADAEIDGLGIPRKHGNCDVGKGNATVRPGVGHRDAYGRPKLRPDADCIGAVYPQRDDPRNLLRPTVRFAPEMANAA